jgi:hypothetical protein
MYTSHLLHDCFKQLSVFTSKIFPYNTYLCKHRTNIYRGVICDTNKTTGYVLGRPEVGRRNLNWIIYGCFTSERVLFHSIILYCSLEIKLKLHCLESHIFYFKTSNFTSSSNFNSQKYFILFPANSFVNFDRFRTEWDHIDVGHRFELRYSKIYLRSQKMYALRNVLKRSIHSFNSSKTASFVGDMNWYQMSVHYFLTNV